MVTYNHSILTIILTYIALLTASLLFWFSTICKYTLALFLIKLPFLRLMLKLMYTWLITFSRLITDKLRKIFSPDPFVLVEVFVDFEIPVIPAYIPPLQQLAAQEAYRIHSANCARLYYAIENTPLGDRRVIIGHSDGIAHGEIIQSYLSVGKSVTYLRLPSGDITAPTFHGRIPNVDTKHFYLWAASFPGDDNTSITRPEYPVARQPQT